MAYTPTQNSLLGGAFALTAGTEFPGLSEKQRSWIYDNTKEEDELSKKQKQYEIYKQVLPTVMATKKADERNLAKQELLYATANEKDESKKKQQEFTLKMADLADEIRMAGLKQGYDASNVSDDKLIGELTKTPQNQQLLVNYFNSGDQEILYANGFKERPVVEEKKTASSIGDFLSGKPIDTSREVSQFLDPLGMKGTGGADPTTALNLVGKSVLNLIPNTISFAKGIGSIIFHPKQTVEGLKSIGQGIIDQSQGQSDTPHAQMVAGMWDSIKETVTDPQKLGEWITNNPLDILTVISPKGTLQLAKEGTKLAGKGVVGTTKVVGKGTAKASEFIASQAFGINPSTIKTIIKDPALYNQVEKGIINSEELLGSLGGKIDERIAKISETGKGYQKIKEIANITSPTDEINQALTKRGIVIGHDGKLNFANTNMADASDMNAIQKAYNFITSQDNLLGGNKINVLNIRGKLDDLINYESKTTSKGQSLVKEFRKIIDEKAKAEIPGLKQLDETYGVQAKELKNIKKDFLNADGTFKDNALSRISNLTKKGNESKLERVKELLPGIEDNINAIRAFEDVTLAGGQKVGAYLRGAGTVGVGAIAGGPVGAVVGLLLTSPQVATNLLKGIGYTKEFINKIASKLKLGSKITQSEMAILEKGAESLSTKKIDGTISTIGNSDIAMNNNRLLSKVAPKNESIPQNRVVVKAPDEPLMAEARKYKSAEEFVKGKATNLHGTKASFEEFSSNKLGTNTNAKSAKEGFFFTDNMENANSYTKASFNGDEIIARIGKMDELKFDSPMLSKRFGYSNPIDAISIGEGGITKERILKQVSDTFDKDILDTQNAIKNHFPKYQQEEYLTKLNSIENNKQKVLDIWDKEFDNIKGTANPNIKKTYLDYKKPYNMIEEKGYKGMEYTKVKGADGKMFKSYTDAIKYAKENGYDAVKIKGATDPLPGNTTIVFNPDQIKTESQLKQIREQANKGLPKK